MPKERQRYEALVEHIAREYGLVLHREAEKIVGKDDADDIMQIMFIEAAKHCDLLAAMPEHKLKSYLFRIVRTRCFNRCSDKKKQQEMEVDIEDTIDATKKEGDIEAEVLLKFDLEECSRLIRQVNERYRSVFMLRYHHGLTNDEIVSVTGLSKGSVRTYIARAIKEARSIAAKEGMFSD